MCWGKKKEQKCKTNYLILYNGGYSNTFCGVETTLNPVYLYALQSMQKYILINTSHLNVSLSPSCQQHDSVN